MPCRPSTSTDCSVLRSEPEDNMLQLGPEDPGAVVHRLAARTIVLRSALAGQICPQEAIGLYPDLAGALDGPASPRGSWRP